jgi:hypothetical protein
MAQINRVNAETGELVYSITSPYSGVSYVCYAGDYMFVSCYDPARVFRVNPRTYAIDGVITLDSLDHPQSMTFDGTYVYVCFYRATNRVLRINAITLEQTYLSWSGNTNSWDIEFDGVDSVWVIDFDTDVYKCNVNTLAQSYFNIGVNVGGIVAGGDCMWILSTYNVLRQYSLSGGLIQSINITTSYGDVKKLCWDGRYVWVLDPDADSVHKVDPDAGTYETINSIGDNPRSISTDGQYIWIANNTGTTEQLTKINIETEEITKITTNSENAKTLVCSGLLVRSNNSGVNIFSDDNHTLSCNTSGALIYYTIDGTEPNETSTLYTGSFTLPAKADGVPTVLKAKAYKSGYAPSLTITRNYYITPAPMYIADPTHNGMAYFYDPGFPRYLLPCTTFDYTAGYSSTTTLFSSYYYPADTWVYYENVNIDQGQQIATCEIRLRGNGSGYNGDTVGFRTFGGKLPNVILPTNISEYNAIPLTTATVDTYYVSNRNDYMTTENLATILQEIVDQPTWENGNSLFFRLRCISKVSYHTSPFWYTRYATSNESLIPRLTFSFA